MNAPSPIKPITRLQTWGVQYGFETITGHFFYHRSCAPAEISVGVHCDTIGISWMLYNSQYYKTADFFTDCGCSEEEITYWVLKLGDILPRKASLEGNTYLGVFSAKDFINCDGFKL